MFYWFLFTAGLLFCSVVAVLTLRNLWVFLCMWIHIHLPIVVPESHVPAGLQNLPVLQPGELGLRLALCLAGEDGGGADRPSDGLWRLNKLCRSWRGKETESRISWPCFHSQKGTATVTHLQVWVESRNVNRKQENMRTQCTDKGTNWG